MVILGVIIAYLLVGLVDLMKMLQKKEDKQIKVYAVLWSIALVFTILINVKFLKIPSIASVLTDLFRIIIPQGG